MALVDGLVLELVVELQSVVEEGQVAMVEEEKVASAILEVVAFVEVVA